MSFLGEMQKGVALKNGEERKKVLPGIESQVEAVHKVAKESLEVPYSSRKYFSTKHLMSVTDMSELAQHIPYAAKSVRIAKRSALAHYLHNYLAFVLRHRKSGDEVGKPLLAVLGEYRELINDCARELGAFGATTQVNVVNAFSCESEYLKLHQELKSASGGGITGTPSGVEPEAEKCAESSKLTDCVLSDYAESSQLEGKDAKSESAPSH